MKYEIFFKHLLRSGTFVALFVAVAFSQNADLKNRFEFEYGTWKTHVEENPADALSHLNEHIYEIAKLGVPVLPLIIEKMEKNKSDFRLAFAFYLITKKTFKKEDWPEGKLGDAHTKAALYIDWWNTGLKNTSNAFNHYYLEWKRYIDEKNAEEAENKLKSIEKLGIAAIPFMINKIDEGDLEFTKIISVLTNGSLSENASKDQCISWWNKNSDKYTIIEDK